MKAKRCYMLSANVALKNVTPLKANNGEYELKAVNLIAYHSFHREISNKH
jgi:hypothetical protein